MIRVEQADLQAWWEVRGRWERGEPADLAAAFEHCASKLLWHLLWDNEPDHPVESQFVSLLDDALYDASALAIALPDEVASVIRMTCGEANHPALQLLWHGPERAPIVWPNRIRLKQRPDRPLAALRVKLQPDYILRGDIDLEREALTAALEGVLELEWQPSGPAEPWLVLACPWCREPRKARYRTDDRALIATVRQLLTVPSQTVDLRAFRQAVHLLKQG